jgi:hypothetical protein
MLADADENEVTNKLFGKESTKAGREKLLKEAGIAEGEDAYSRTLKLGAAYKAGKIGPQELKYLFGERGMRAGMNLLESPEQIQAVEADLRQKTYGPDILGNKYKQVMEADKTTSGIQKGKELDAGIIAVEQHSENLLKVNFAKALDKLRKQTGGGIIDKWAYEADAAAVNMGPIDKSGRYFQAQEILARRLRQDAHLGREAAKVRAARELDLPGPVEAGWKPPEQSAPQPQGTDDLRNATQAMENMTGQVGNLVRVLYKVVPAPPPGVHRE